MKCGKQFFIKIVRKNERMNSAMEYRNAMTTIFVVAESPHAVYGAEHSAAQTERHVTYTEPHTTRNFINKKSKLLCNSEGTDEFAEDGTQLPKHVEAAE
jgi:hypothetical protein